MKFDMTCSCSRMRASEHGNPPGCVALASKVQLSNILKSSSILTIFTH